MRNADGSSSNGRAVMVTAVLGVGVTLLALPSCAQPRQTEQTRPQMGVRSGTPVLHGVYAQEIRDAMRELNDLAADQLWMQLYLGSPQVDMTQVSASAEKMADVAGNRLPNLVGAGQLQPDELQIYRNLARRLHEQAVILKQQANNNQLTAAQVTTNQIIDTCNTCHTMFRGVAGPIQ